MADFLDHVDFAIGTASDAAVKRTATVVTGTIAARTSTNVSVTLADGSTVPNVLVLHPYVPRVGDVVRLAQQGNSLVVLGAHSVPTAEQVQYLGPQSFYTVTSSASYAALSTQQRVLVTVGASGLLMCHLRARLSPAATARAHATLRVTDTSGTSIVLYNNPLIEAPAGAGTFSLGGTYMFSGLTRGQQVYVECVAATGTAGVSVQVGFVNIQANPIP